MAHYLVGDIQGCYDPLSRLLEKIHFDPAVDRLIALGDVVNRGGHSLAVLRLLFSLREQVTVTLGNHDIHLLADAWLKPSSKGRNAEFLAIKKATDGLLLLDWLRSQPLAVWLREFDTLALHAGVIPQWDKDAVLKYAAEVETKLRGANLREFSKQIYGDKPRRWRKSLTGWERIRLINNVLTRIRYCDHKGRINFADHGRPKQKRSEYLPWFQHAQRKTGSITIAFGHWATLGLHLKPGLIGLDSGCVWGGQLSALRLEDQQLFQVEAAKQ